MFNVNKKGVFSVSANKISWFQDVRLAIMKVTNRCNISCEYCYARAHSKGQDMSADLFCDIAHDVIVSTKSDKIRFLLHGGEPTLLSKKWYIKVLSFLRKVGKSYSKDIIVSMQTNLIKINIDKLLLLKKYNVRISGSLDDPTNDVLRMRPKSQDAIKTLLMAKKLGIHIGILMNLNPLNLNKVDQMCHWIYDNLKKKYFKLNIMHSVGTGDKLLTLSADEIFDSQKKVIEYMIQTGGQATLEKNLAEEVYRYFQAYVFKRSLKSNSLCDGIFCRAGTKVLSFDASGNIFPCGRCDCNNIKQSIGCYQEYFNLKRSEKELFFKQIKEFHCKNNEIWRSCYKCHARYICGYGCKAFILRSNSLINIECEPTLKRFDFYQKNIDRLGELYQSIVDYSAIMSSE